MKIINTIKQRDNRLVIQCMVDKPRTLQLDGPALQYLAQRKHNVMQGWRPASLTENVRFLYACTLTSQGLEGHIGFDSFAQSLFSSQIREMFMVTAELLTNTETEDATAVPYVPTHADLISRAFAMLYEHSKQSTFATLIDLGCGDGRVLLKGAMERILKLIGYETNPQRAVMARGVLQRYAEKTGSVYAFDVYEQSLLDVDYSAIGSNAVVFAYLMPDVMHRLEPRIAQAPEGTLIVTHDFQFPSWVAVTSATLTLPDKDHTLYLYEIGKQVETVIDMGKPLTNAQLDLLADDLFTTMGVQA